MILVWEMAQLAKCLLYTVRTLIPIPRTHIKSGVVCVCDGQTFTTLKHTAQLPAIYRSKKHRRDPDSDKPESRD